MLKKKEWDTDFFGKKMGVFLLDNFTEAELNKDLKEAENNKYDYIVCQLESPKAETIRLLESKGFYLSDVGVIWLINVDEYLSMFEREEAKSVAVVTKASIESLKNLQGIIRPMFPNSRFYSDPFFSQDEADNLHMEWMKNSIMGKVADVVLQIPGKGFVTCKKKENRIGEIILIGVVEEFRGRNLGKSLMDASVTWFSDYFVKSIRVKTQLKNVDAMNFYRKLGFSIKNYDMTFSLVM
jgi:dTDP-4-amino-4,6-dideoxy-D-galactose acyltransferase